MATEAPFKSVLAHLPIHDPATLTIFLFFLSRSKLDGFPWELKYYVRQAFVNSQIMYRDSGHWPLLSTAQNRVSNYTIYIIGMWQSDHCTLLNYLKNIAPFWTIVQKIAPFWTIPVLSCCVKPPTRRVSRACCADDWLPTIHSSFFILRSRVLIRHPFPVIFIVYTLAV